MCGIAAAVGPVERVDGLVRGLMHRGPDHAGSVRWGRFSIGAARLRIAGDERADQPIEAPGGLALVANGEVFNHAALREGAGDPAEGDLPPLARALDSRFPGALDAVRGPFALAAIHRRSGRLLIARDEMAVRPLHVRTLNDGILVASEIWPLVAGPGPGPAVDQDALAHLLAFQFLPPGATLLRDVASLRAGEVVVYDASGAIVGRESCRYARTDADDLGAALRVAARLQGPRSGRAAVFLSGGIDSSAVAGLLTEAGHAPDLAITGWFPEGDPGQDERGHARAVAAELGLPLLEVPILASDALEVLPALVRALGGPLAGPGGLGQLLLARAAAEAGCRVVYSGEGGDELFGGYERHRLLQRIDSGQPLDPLPGYGPLARAMQAAEDPLAAAIFRGEELLPLLRHDRALEVAAAALAALPTPGPDRAGRALSFELERFLPGLLAVDDATLAAFGIEGRVPLADPVVASIAAGVPLVAKSPPDAPRRLLREALGSALPRAAARRRDKMGFPMPLATWLSAPPWRDYALDRMRGDALDRFGFDSRRVRTAFEEASLRPRTAWFLLGLDAFDHLLNGATA